MSKLASGCALGFALLIVFCGPASAEKVRMNYECTCTCVATDDKGNRIEGPGSITFQTSGSDCSVGRKTGCVAGNHKGTYASCTGRNLGTPPKGGPPEPAATGH